MPGLARAGGRRAAARAPVVLAAAVPRHGAGGAAGVAQPELPRGAEGWAGVGQEGTEGATLGTGSSLTARSAAELRLCWGGAAGTA